MVDETPIRVHKNLEDKGIPFTNAQAMGVYSSIWNADDWATQGGLVKTEWSHAPFIASYKDFKIDACEVPTTTDISKCNGEVQRFWWDEPTVSELSLHQNHQLIWVRANHMIYDYCYDAMMLRGFLFLLLSANTIAICSLTLTLYPNFPLLEKCVQENCLGLKELRVSCLLLQEFTLKNSLQLDSLEVSSNKPQTLKVVNCFHLYSEDSVMKINKPNLKTLPWNSNTVTTSVYFLNKLVCMGKAFVGVLLLHQHITSQTQSLFTLLSDLCHSYKLQLGNQFAGVIYIEREIQYWEFQTYEVESFLNKLESVEIHGYLRVRK
uniref:Xyloglucan endotransglucosylase/hydrolase n=1 Tax=Brassica oleracea var. oleracea TaxID=109376 RepID=A0A0D3B8L6_BRAOL